MAARVQLREITNDEGNRLLRMVRRTSGSVVTWRRAQIVLLSAQGMSQPRISEVVFTDPDTVRNVIHNFNADGFDSLYPRYRGGRPRTFTIPERHQIKRIALSVPTDLGSGDPVSNRTFTVVNHEIVLYSGTHAMGTSPQGKTIIQVAPFDLTSNDGGVYIMAVCQVGATSPSQCKYDAFHADPDDVPPPSPPHPLYELTPRLILALLDGLALDAIHGGHEARVADVLDALKRLAARAF